MDNKGYTEKLTDIQKMNNTDNTNTTYNTDNTDTTDNADNTDNTDNTDKVADSENTVGVDAAKNVFVAYNIEHTEKMDDAENVVSTEGNDIEVRSEYAESSLENEDVNTVDSMNKKKIDIALIEENELDKLKGTVKGYSVRLLTDKLLEKGFVGDNMSHIVDNSTLFNQIKECNASGLPVVGFFRKKKMFGCFIFEKITIKKDSLEPIPDIDTDTLNIIRIKNCYVHEDAKNVEAEMLEVAHHDAYTVLTESMMDGSDKNKFDGLTWNNLVYIVKKDKKNGGYLAGLPIGIALGIIYGMLFENLILGICIGLCLGMCFGMSYGNIFGSTGYRLVVNTEEKDTLKDE